MEVKAKARYIRMSPRKVRLVIDLIRGLDIEKAYAQLEVINKAAVRPVRKVIDSAVANAYHNFEIEKDNLFIKEIRVDEGPTQYRWKPRAHGRATPLRRRSSHIIVTLGEKVPSNKKEPKAKKAEKTLSKATKEQVKGDVRPQTVDRDDKKVNVENQEAKDIFDVKRKGKHRDQQHMDRKTSKDKGFLKKIFKRKSNT